MRIDKYLKVSRLIKDVHWQMRHANRGRIKVNDKVAKPGTDIEVGDIIEIQFGNTTTRAKVISVAEHVLADSKEMYEILSN